MHVQVCSGSNLESRKQVTRGQFFLDITFFQASGDARHCQRFDVVVQCYEENVTLAETQAEVLTRSRNFIDYDVITRRRYTDDEVRRSGGLQISEEGI